VVLVEGVVEAIVAFDGAAVCSGEWVWWAQFEPAMGVFVVVVVEEVVEYALGVAFVGDRELVEALSA